MDIRGRISRFPATRDHEPTIRVDLSCLLMGYKPYSRSNKNYLGDDVGTPDYGWMLSQQLRRLDGVGTVEITHYGCKVEVGGIFDLGVMSEEIRSKTEFVLSSRTPWTVSRDRAGGNWAYTFAHPLLHVDHGVVSAVHAASNSDVTQLGRRLARIRNDDLGGGPYSIHPYSMFMNSTGMDRGWPAVDSAYDRLVAEAVKPRRNFKMIWE